MVGVFLFDLDGMLPAMLFKHCRHTESRGRERRRRRRAKRGEREMEGWSDSRGGGRNERVGVRGENSCGVRTRRQTGRERRENQKRERERGSTRK